MNVECQCCGAAIAPDEGCYILTVGAISVKCWDNGKRSSIIDKDQRYPANDRDSD